jgi:hypothetical protein
MSIEGYFGRAPWDLRMPRLVVDASALEVTGEVKPAVVEERPVVYRRVEDYDPVLRSHCRL